MKESGYLALVSTGLGVGTMMSLDAKTIIEECDVIVGYERYLDDINTLLTHKHVISSGMTEEIERVNRAIELASENKKVALISNGDVNVFGMATLAVELLEQKKLEDQIQLISIPGVTAIFYLASKVGAPISQDFAVISLSDRLTPIERIEKRIHNAVEGDFVMGIYNPISKTRKLPYEKLLEKLAVKSKQTPVVIGSHLGREESENIIITDCKTLIEEGSSTEHVHMSSVLIIGNTSTKRTLKGRVLTTRGYLHKYNEDGKKRKDKT